MTEEKLNNPLSLGKIVALPLETWNRPTERFELLEDRDTRLAGHLRLTPIRQRIDFVGCFFRNARVGGSSHLARRPRLEDSVIDGDHRSVLKWCD